MKSKGEVCLNGGDQVGKVGRELMTAANGALTRDPRVLMEPLFLVAEFNDSPNRRVNAPRS